MKPIISSTIAITTLLALTACSDPADQTTDAAVTEAAPIATATATAGSTYQFTPASTIGFVGSKVTGSHDGGFKDFTGYFIIESGNPVAGEFTIVMDSIWSDSENLTGHLKAPDFFDVENHPTAKFEVSAFTKKSETEYELSGNLTLRGTTKNITFPTQVAVDGQSVHVTAEFDINRQDFGVAYPGKKDDLIRDAVIIKFDLMAEPRA